MKVALVALEVLRNALLMVTDEMGIGLQRSAYSSNIKTRLDFACAIFDSERRNIVQALHQPSLLGALVTLVPRVVEVFGAENFHSGDGIIVNDPHMGGTHLPDITLISPVFHGSELFGYVANMAHHQDVGGMTPGSVPGDSTEIHQEGLIIPPTRLLEGGHVRRDILDLILANVRSPRERAGDYRAQAACNNIGIRRLGELIERYGAENLRLYMEEILSYTERRMRTAMKAIPSGIYYAEDYLDSDGVTGRPVKVAVEVTVDGDESIVDLSGSDGQGPGPVNATYGPMLSAVSYVFKCLGDPDIPVNDGMYRPLHVVAPEGSVVNARPPAAVAGCWEVGQRICDVIVKAFVPILPEKVCAAGKGIICNISFGGIDPKSGNVYTFYETIGGGYGARPTKDGIDGIQYHLTNTQNAPVEEIELSHPVLIERYELIPDSEGAGKLRGGLGMRRDYRFFGGPTVFSVQSDRARFSPWGIFGGLNAKPSRYIVNPDSDEPLLLTSKSTVRLKKGDIVSVQTPGGGGYGSPMERDPEMVLRDVIDGKVSLKRAMEIYGVVADPIMRKVDYGATGSLRRSLMTTSMGEVY